MIVKVEIMNNGNSSMELTDVLGQTHSFKYLIFHDFSSCEYRVLQVI